MGLFTEVAVSRLLEVLLIEKSAWTTQQGLQVETYQVLRGSANVTLGKHNFRDLGKISQNLTVFTNFHCAGMRTHKAIKNQSISAPRRFAPRCFNCFDSINIKYLFLLKSIYLRFSLPLSNFGEKVMHSNHYYQSQWILKLRIFLFRE